MQQERTPIACNVLGLLHRRLVRARLGLDLLDARLRIRHASSQKGKRANTRSDNFKGGCKLKSVARMCAQNLEEPTRTSNDRILDRPTAKTAKSASMTAHLLNPSVNTTLLNPETRADAKVANQLSQLTHVDFLVEGLAVLRIDLPTRAVARSRNRFANRPRVTRTWTR